MGPRGRKQLVEFWVPYLPLYTQSESINQQANIQNVTQNNGTSGHPPNSPDVVVRSFKNKFSQLI